jgi:hypothetical protein
MANAGGAARERLTLIRLFEELRTLGYAGGYDAIRRYARQWGREHASQTAAAFVPLSFAPGEAYQFDWSHEIVVINGTTVTVKVAHVRLCHSRMMFARGYPRETQEMVTRQTIFGTSSPSSHELKTYASRNKPLRSACSHRQSRASPVTYQ